MKESFRFELQLRGASRVPAQFRASFIVRHSKRSRNEERFFAHYFLFCPFPVCVGQGHVSSSEWEVHVDGGLKWTEVEYRWFLRNQYQNGNFQLLALGENWTQVEAYNLIL